MSDKKPNPYMRFAGMGFQMVAFILIFVALGYKLDEWTHTTGPWWLVGMSLLGVIMSMIYMILSVNKNQ